MTLEPSFNNELGLDLRMTNASIRHSRVGVEVDLLNDIRTTTINQFGVDLRMTNALIHFFRVGIQVDLLNDIRTII